MRAFAIVFSLLIGAGCGTTTLVCDPACPSGFHCELSGCVADVMDSSVADLAAAEADCTPACGGLTPYCNSSHACVPCLVDTQCPLGQVCETVGVTTACAPGCKDDGRCGAGDGGVSTSKCCAGQCTDTSSDAQNCGACGTVCSAQHSSSTCQASACQPGVCAPGWSDCDGDPKNGCEANLHVDPMNCTACGMACTLPNAITACSDSCYLAACDFGWDDCNGDPSDGCETSVLTDPLNCGGCGVLWTAPAHAKATCVNASCVLNACSPGYSDCDGNAQNGCEVDTGTDASNCGACGNVCAQGLVCLNSSCTCPQCSIPNSKTQCVNNQCVFASCLPGYGDCDNNTANGCEDNLGTDAKNCGACNMPCPNNTPYCFNGACQAMLPGTLLGTINGQSYYKVPVTGVMSDTNVFAACKASGFHTPCQATPGCQYNDNVCVPTQENSCGNPMELLAKTICNSTPPTCAALNGCYQYMGHTWQNDSACGADNNSWCAIGDNAMNRFAVCVP